MNRFYLIMVLILSITINSCDNAEDVNRFYWNQTKCADPWMTGENDTNDETEVALRSFLENENVIIQNLGFDNNSPLDISCESCGCGTGQRIIVEVINSDVSTMKELNFYQ